MSSRFAHIFKQPTLVQGERVATNDTTAPATGLRRIAMGYNSITTHQRKMLALRTNHDAPTAADANEDNHYFVFRTGENVKKVVAWVGMQRASQLSGTARASCQMRIYDGTSTLTSNVAYMPTVNTGTAYPVTWAKLEINVDDDSLLTNTEYRGSIRQLNYSRVYTVMVYEEGEPIADSTANSVCDPAYWETNKPILDAAAQDLAECGYSLWSKNACHLIGYCRQDLANVSKVTGTGEVNLLDTSITGGTWSATTPGFVLNTQYHDTISGDVPVVLGVYATRETGTSGNLTVRIKRNGSTIITGTIVAATSPFHSSTHTITARASDKVDITIEAAGSDRWRVDALGLWEYEA